MDRVKHLHQHDCALIATSGSTSHGNELRSIEGIDLFYVDQRNTGIDLLQWTGASNVGVGVNLRTAGLCTDYTNTGISAPEIQGVSKKGCETVKRGA